jgi:predicted nucleotidyltransferase
MKFEMPPELDDLLSILADWAAPATSAKIFLFGSRVRGDHRPNSDVDISVKWTSPPDDQTTDWWTANNAEEFESIDAKLPGRLHVPEPNETEFHAKVQSSEIVHTRGNIYCVWLKGKR